VGSFRRVLSLIGQNNTQGASGLLMEASVAVWYRRQIGRINDDKFAVHMSDARTEEICASRLF